MSILSLKMKLVPGPMCLSGNSDNKCYANCLQFTFVFDL